MTDYTKQLAQDVINNVFIQVMNGNIIKNKKNYIKKFFFSNIKNKVLNPYDPFVHKRNFSSEFYKFSKKTITNNFVQMLWRFIETEEKKSQTEKELFNILHTCEKRCFYYNNALQGIMTMLQYTLYTFIYIDRSTKNDNYYFNYIKVYKIIEFFLKFRIYFYTSTGPTNVLFETMMISQPEERVKFLSNEMEKDKWYNGKTAENFFSFFLENLNKEIIDQRRKKINVTLTWKKIDLKEIDLNEKDENAIVNASTTTFLYYIELYKYNCIQAIKKYLDDKKINFNYSESIKKVPLTLTLNPPTPKKGGGMNIRCKNRSYTKKKKNKNQSHTKKKNQSYKKKYNMRMQRKTRRKL